MNGWRQVRVERRAEDRVVVVDTLEPVEPVEPVESGLWDAEASAGDAVVVPAGDEAAAHVEARVPVRSRVKPRPLPVVCSTCTGVGTLEVVDGFAMTTTTTTSSPTVVGPPRSQSWTRTVACGTCRGLGWVLVAPQLGVVPPRTPAGVLPPAAPWWAPPPFGGFQSGC